MKPGRARRRRGATATRDAVLRAAEELFLVHGYAGASLDDILAAAGVSKGAFFHHFSSKAALAHAVLAAYAERIAAVFARASDEAGQEAAEPLARALRFFTLCEERLAAPEGVGRGCVFACYTNETGRFDPQMRALIGERMLEWRAALERVFAPVIAARKPRIPARARDLAEAVICLIEGAIVAGRATEDARCLQRQLAGFRRYVELLFA